MPAAAAVVPGLLVHGTGHWAAGDPDTGKKLLQIEAAGMGAFLAGGVTVVLTGASRRVITLAAAATGIGFGVFVLSAVADIYGAAGGAALAAPAPTTLPVLELDFGYRYVREPLFQYSALAGGTVSGRFGAFRLEPSLWTALDDDNLRYRFAGVWRLTGPKPAPAPRARDGSHVDVEVAATVHRFGPERFTTRTLEASLLGRYDLARISPTLGGSFAELGLGWGVAATSYRIDGLDIPPDVSDMLLMRIAYGVYLGETGRGDGELQAFYDHRRDGYARGLPVPGIGGGVLGHAGLRGHYYVSRSWGIGAEAIAGSAWIAGASVRYRLEGDR